MKCILASGKQVAYKNEMLSEYKKNCDWLLSANWFILKRLSLKAEYSGLSNKFARQMPGHLSIWH